MRFENHSSKDDYWEKCLMSLVIRKMQIKSTMSYHDLPTRKAKMETAINTIWWRGYRATETHYIDGEV